jgi:hypothetical protein
VAFFLLLFLSLPPSFYLLPNCLSLSLSQPGQPRLALNLWSSCLYLLSAGIIDVLHHPYLFSFS